MFQPAHSNTLTSSGIGLLPAGPQAQARLANPSAEAVGLARALVSVLSQAGHAWTPEVAVDAMLNAVSKFRDAMAVNDAKGAPRSIRTAAPQDGVQTGYAERARSAPETREA